MKKLLSRSAAAVLAVLSACGGNVLVDGGGSGTGGTGGSTTLTSTGTGAASCFDLPTASSLTPCGGSSGGPGSVCSFFYNCGDPGGAWEADCSGISCQCLHAGMEICSCALVGSTADICAGAPDCCFH